MNPEIIITNLKKRYTGVSGTINALLPIQSNDLKVGYLGSPIPGAKIAENKRDNFKKFSLLKCILISMSRLPDGRKRIWHVRRDHEMILAIFLRDFLRLPILIVFTSAAKHQHSWFPSWLIQKMNGVISTTPEAAAFVPNTLLVVPHGISLKRFSPPENKITAWKNTGLSGKYGIGTFGRVRPDKGTDIYIDAMLELLPEFPEFTAIIAGLCQPQHHKYRDSLLKKISEKGLKNRILFIGEISASEVGEWYKNVLITVACPRYEPFGLTPLEGMACECAIVASDTGAFKTIVNEGITGFVIPTDNSHELVLALRKLMENPSRTYEMGKLGRKRVEEFFSIEMEANGISQAYKLIWEMDKK